MGVTRLMRYKVGDKVKIKTWEQMEKEYVTSKEYGVIENYKPTGIMAIPSTFEQGPIFRKDMEENLNKNYPDRILTIKGRFHNTVPMKNGDREQITYYSMYGEHGALSWNWTNYMIECLAKDYKEPVCIETRWELLDL